MSPPGFGCVITRTSRECAELLSQFPSSGRCCSSFHIDEIEKKFLRNSSAKVFTQPGSSTDLDSAQPRGLLYHKERIWPARPVRSESCHQHTRRCTCVGRQRVEPLEEFHPTHPFGACCHQRFSFPPWIVSKAGASLRSFDLTVGTFFPPAPCTKIIVAPG